MGKHSQRPLKPPLSAYSTVNDKKDVPFNKTLIRSYQAFVK